MLLLKSFTTPEQQEERTLDVAVRDGMAHAVTIGAAETYFPAFGIFLRATALQIGLLAALPPVCAAFAQMFSLKLLEQIRSRRFLIAAGARLQAMSLIPILLLPFIVSRPVYAVPFLIVFVILYFSAAGITLPLWSSLIGDLVPGERRGRFFGLRNQRAGIRTLGATLFAGAVLDRFEVAGITAWGFALIFAVAAAARFLSAHFLSQYEDPVYDPPSEAYFSFWQFLTRARFSNFTRFVFFVSCIHFGAALSAPFFAVYMLRDLQFPYWEYTIVICAMALTQVFTLRHWGRIADTFGSKKILNLCSIGVAMSPMLWIFSSNLWYLLLVQVFSGIVWSGFNIAVSMFLFDAVSAPKRARCAAYQAVVQAAFILAGSLLGGFLADHITSPANFGLFTWQPSSPFLLIFMVSGCIRMCAAIAFRKKFSEVRTVTPTRSIKLIVHLFPVGSLFDEVAHFFTMTFRKKRK